MGVRKRLPPEEEMVKKMKEEVAEKEWKRKREERMNKPIDAYVERLKKMHKTMKERKRKEEEDKAEAKAKANGDRVGADDDNHEKEGAGESEVRDLVVGESGSSRRREATGDGEGGEVGESDVVNVEDAEGGE